MYLSLFVRLLFFSFDCLRSLIVCVCFYFCVLCCVLWSFFACIFSVGTAKKPNENIHFYIKTKMGYTAMGVCVCVRKSLKPYIISLVMPPHNDTTNAALNKIMGRKMKQQRFGIKSVNSIHVMCVVCCVLCGTIEYK